MSNLPIPLAHTTREVVFYRRYGYVNPVCCDPLENKPFFPLCLAPEATSKTLSFRVRQPAHRAALSAALKGGSDDHG